MSLLTDTDLRSKICIDENRTNRNQIHIYPFKEENLTPVGYDLRVGNRYVSKLKGKMFELSSQNKIVIRPRDTVLIEALELIEMPEDKSISGLIMPRVSLTAKGLTFPSGTADPDWKGKPLIIFTNHAKRKVELSQGESACTFVFFENTSPATKLGDKPSNRTDILLNEFLAKAKVKGEWLRYVIPSGIIAISIAIGAIFFGDSNAFPGIVAAGVGLATIIHLIMERW